MKKDNKKFGWILASLFTLLVTGCNVGDNSSSQTETSSINKTSNSQATSSSKVTSSSNDDKVSSSISLSDSSSKTESSSTLEDSSSESSSDSSTSSSESSKEEVQAEVSILNKLDLSKSWPINKGDRIIEIAINEGFNADLALQNGEIVITSSDENVIEVYGLYLHPVAEGSATIKVQYKDASDSVDIVISASELTAPTFLFDYDGVTQFQALQNESVSLPNFICYDKNLNDISSNVIVTSDKDPNATYDFATGKFTSSVVGSHTVSFTAVDPDNTDLKTTKSVIVNIYRKLFKNDPVSNVYQYYDNENQYVELKDGGMTPSRFNLENGKVYYAEAVYNTTYNVTAGLMHVAENEYNSNQRWLYMALNPLTNQMEIKDNISWEYGNSITQTNIKNTMGINIAAGSYKVATARIGDMFYLFINDKYVESYASARYADVDTAPGLYMNAYSDSDNVINNFVKVTKIDFYNDEAKVQEKVESLTQGKILKPYVVNLDYWTYSPENYTFGYSKERGNYVDMTYNNVGPNSSIWSPYINFAGSFSFEFDYAYESSSAAETTQDGRMWVELRQYNNGTPQVEFGAKYSMADPQFMLDREQYVDGGGKGYSNGSTSKYSQPTMSSLGVSKTDTFHYKITRILYTDHSDFIMEVSKLDGTVLKTKTYSNADLGATSELTVLVQNKFVKGKFSNITWSTDVSSEGDAA